MGNIDFDYEKEFFERFKWREKQYINNIKDLAEITQSTGLNPLESFPCLYAPNSSNKLDSLQFSILLLSYEATSCYVFGLFQSCIITCGALVERILKLEYLKKNPQLPTNGEWTLGKLIYKLNWSDTRINSGILDSAEQIKSSRNDRIHANSEQSDPLLTSMGGENRGIEFLDANKYLIEPFRGDARKAIEHTFKILRHLYSTKNNNINS